MITQATTAITPAFDAARAMVVETSRAVREAEERGASDDVLNALTDLRADRVFALMATPARTLGDLEQKLAVGLIAAHAESDLEQADHTAIAARVVRGRTFDDGLPLGRAYMDVSAMLKAARKQSSDDLRRIASRLCGWAEAERAALDLMNELETAGSEALVPNCHLSGLDALLEQACAEAAAIPAKTPDDFRHKGRVLQAITQSSRWGAFELSENEEALIKSLADDFAGEP